MEPRMPKRERPKDDPEQSKRSIETIKEVGAAETKKGAEKGL
jgi:hypothetical protein